MGLIITIAFLFCAGSLAGWIIEVVFRNCIKRSRVKGVFVNPGFCAGPYLPIYGIGLTVMFLISYTQSMGMVDNSVMSYILLFLSIAFAMTVIEFIGGLFLLKVLNMRLWDYRGEFANIMGLICLKFSLAWAILAALYFFLIHPVAFTALIWIGNNLQWTFFIGLFLGLYLVDLIYSSYVAATIRKYGSKENIVILYDQLKAEIQKEREKENKRKRIFLQNLHGNPIDDSIKKYGKSYEKKQSETEAENMSEADNKNP